MKDAFGRRVEYLRISVTDKCNLRCVYCMPLEGMPWMRRSDLLTYEEIEHVVRIMAGMGLRRVRITGGEPLVRRDLPELVRRIEGVDGIDDLSLSTNAVLLADQAEALKDAGIRRINWTRSVLSASRPSPDAPGATDRSWRASRQPRRWASPPLRSTWSSSVDRTKTRSRTSPP
jgi:cyclic pyranopterin phosphate synthase